MTTFGYGEISETPALMFMKYIEFATLLDGVLSAIGLGKNVPTRFVVFQELFQSMAASLMGQVYLSADIQNVVYGQSETDIFFSVGDGNSTQQMSCGSTIIAFPPLNGDIDIFSPPEAAQTLQSLASQIHTGNFYAVLLDDTEQFFKELGGYFAPFQDRVPDNPAIILAYAKMFETAGTPVMGYYLSPSLKTEDDAKTEILKSYSTLVGKPVDESVILAFEPWVNYFPHPTEQALRDGFYQNFDELQGVSRQFYAGGLFSFDTIQQTMAHARYIVEEYLA